MDMAANLDQGVLPAYCPIMLYSSIIRVWSCTLVRNCHDRANSVQPAMKPKKPVTARAGKAKGSTICTNTWLGEAPSMIAASSNSLGMVSRKPFRFQIENGSMPETIDRKSVV